MTPSIVVAAAVVEQDRRILLTRRLRGTHLAGLWELPGGKREPGELLAECLTRELREELGVGAVVGAEILVTRHEYLERSVELHFFECVIDRPPAPLLGQDIRWATRDELDSLELPPADAELIQLLRQR